ncbi:MAG: metal ABC transporter ATP-binding protein [Treponema sp.]|nr:metal ABC transporter ATP-binding protein [Treponema sp.]
MDNNIAVKFDSVSFSYNDVQVLKDASFHIHEGEFVAMVGPNGSGKTTVLKLLFGLEKPNKGTIDIFDTAKPVNGSSTPLRLCESKISYVSQHIPADNLFPITVRDIVRMGLLHPHKGYVKNTNNADEALEKTGIAALASRTYRSLSGGQKRRALVARALAAKPQLLVLDEPTANMDADSEKRLYETLGAYKGKMTILIVTHDTEFVTSLTDRVLCLGDSYKIVQHRTEENAAVHHGGAGHEVRVLHEENITCC